MLDLDVKVIDNKWSVAKFTKIENIKDSNYVEWSDGETRFFTNIICINKQDPHKPFVVYNKDINILTSLVAVINREPMVWRARCGKCYYYIDSFGDIDTAVDLYSTSDDTRYNLGNYFETEIEAKRVLDSKEWREFWSKVRGGKIGNE